MLENGSVQRNLTTTVADNETKFNNTRIRCVVVNSDDVSASFESLNFIIVIQGTYIMSKSQLPKKPQLQTVMYIQRLHQVNS